MSKVPVLVIDDAEDGPGVGERWLGPLCDLRPVFEVRTGASTTLERLTRDLGGRAWGTRVRAALGEFGATFARPGVSDDAADVLSVSGRCVLPAWEEMDALAPGEALVERESGRWIACRGPASACGGLMEGLLPAGTRARTIDRRVLVARVWHVRSMRDEAMARDLAWLVSHARDAEVFPPGRALGRPGVFEVRGGSAGGGHAIVVGEGATVGPAAVLDASGGPIVLARGCAIRAGAVVVGPASVGEGSIVVERSLIKASTAIGPVCRVAGEVGGTIVQGFSNKAHDGHLGDSWLGEWVNLGAGTTNSNLLNTYGEVICRSTPEGPNERTGERFLGAVIGDHVKSAIMSRLMTGCVLHTGAMVATSTPISGCVPAFAWWTDEGRRRYRPEKFVEVARAMMSRRGVSPTGAYESRLRALLAGV